LKAACGLDVGKTSSFGSLCADAILQPNDLMVVEVALVDDSFGRSSAGAC